MKQEFIKSSNVKSRTMYALSIGFIVFVILAFGIAAFVQPVRQQRYIKPLVIIHIITSMGWLFLFMYQSKLILKGKIDKHRKNVKLGLALMFVITLIAVYITYEWGDAIRLIAESRDAIVFSILFLIAIRYAKKGKYDWHTRFMLAAALNLINPAFIRVVFSLGLPPPTVLLFSVGAWVAIPIIYDRITRGKIHKASLMAMAITLLSFGLVVAITLSPLMQPIEIFLYGESYVQPN